MNEVYMMTKKVMVFTSVVLFIVLFTPTAAAEMSAGFNTSAIEDRAVEGTITPHLSENFDFGDNFYTTYGTPDLKASLMGNNELSTGDTVDLAINLANKGKIEGFKIENEADDDLDVKLQTTEKGYETERTTAIGITSTLISPYSFIDVKTGSQNSGTIRSGEETKTPSKFVIDIADRAPSGTYSLILNTVYGYQENVQVSGDELTADGRIKDLEIGIWYKAKSQNHTVPVVIKKEADFEVVDVESNLRGGDEGLLKVTYKNTGNLPARDATARISTYTPFSTTDDQAFIGTLEPGETSEAVFSLNVDDGATPKMYSINSEIRYDDVDDEKQLSDTIKVSVQTLPTITLGDRISSNLWILYLLIPLVIVVGGFIGYRKFIKNKKTE